MANNKEINHRNGNTTRQSIRICKNSAESTQVKQCPSCDCQLDAQIKTQEKYLEEFYPIKEPIRIPNNTNSFMLLTGVQLKYPSKISQWALICIIKRDRQLDCIWLSHQLISISGDVD